ncbi:alpha/beta hydrolase [Zunongwangia sp. F260]|uniref:Alpha/beta hydrolase n=1 Tax=Autumnicola lenta TaxID=3075593 RepID=A0ABU3CNU1_9FLAO|nr:alpha/beta hydrolase [Zunongwangia sp. F260]MDT0648015.1 alpha/beta hydrolase [Zunongwangia sp. F260]
MKLFFTILFVISTISVKAQERYIDDIFEFQEPVTKTYTSKDGEDLKLDLYQPVKDNLEKRPLIVFMHGGGFSGGTRKSESEVKFAQAAAAKGYVAVSISYRLTRKGKSFNCDFAADGKIETFKMAAEDFLDAVKFLIDNKEEFGIDPSKIIVGGSSAGAEAVLNAVYNKSLLFEETEYKDIKFAGVFSLAGALLDARYITRENAVPAIFFHGTQDKVVPYVTAPHHYCDKSKPGYLILDGSKTIAEKLKELDVSYALYSVEGGGHGVSRMPFEDLPEVFEFFKRMFLEESEIQVNFVKQLNEQK